MAFSTLRMQPTKDWIVGTRRKEGFVHWAWSGILIDFGHIWVNLVTYECTFLGNCPSPHFLLVTKQELVHSAWSGILNMVFGCAGLFSSESTIIPAWERIWRGGSHIQRLSHRKKLQSSLTLTGLMAQTGSTESKIYHSLSPIVGHAFDENQNIMQTKMIFE